MAAMVAGVVGRLLTRWLSALLSREAMLDADAGAVGIGKNPRALADVFSRDRAGEPRLDVPAETGPLFLFNPSPAKWEEASGLMADLFSAHPPLGRRLRQLEALATGGDLAEEDETSLGKRLNALMLRGSGHFFKARAVQGGGLWQALFLGACIPSGLLFLLTLSLYGDPGSFRVAPGLEEYRSLILLALNVAFFLPLAYFFRLWRLSVRSAAGRRAQ
jgi:hypothetical protein